jgi:hypothetical protein
MAKKAFGLQPSVKSGLTLRGAMVVVPLMFLIWFVHSLSVGMAVALIIGAWIVLMLATRAVDTHDRARLRALLL